MNFDVLDIDLNKQGKKLKKLQKKLIKEKARMTKLAQHQLKQVDISEVGQTLSNLPSLREMGKLAEREVPKAWKRLKKSQVVQRAQDFEIPERVQELVPTKRCPLRGWAGIALGLAVVAGIVALVVKAIKAKSRDEEENRFEFISTAHENASDDKTFDFESASLDELEEALKQVEDDLNSVTEALEQKTAE